MPPLVRLRDRRRALGREASVFLVVGAIALGVDVGLYNLLVHVGEPGPLADSPLTAKTLSVCASTTVAYVGNRWWTYRHRPRGRVAREFALFVVLSAAALGIALVCLAVSRYLLGLTSALADNVSANVVGLALGTAFRFLSYRRWVFRPEPARRTGSAGRG